MARFIPALLFAAIFLLPVTGAAESSDLEFVSPLPGSSKILPETNIILRPGGMVDAASLSHGKLLHVSGSVSGAHEGRLRLSDDGRTLTLQPGIPFAPGEVVTCRLEPGITTNTRGAIPPAEFAFTIAGPERLFLRDFEIPGEFGEELHAGDGVRTSAAIAESLPPDFPPIRATVYGTPAPGRLFLADFHFGFSGPQIPSHLMILENDGTPFFHRKLAGTGLDFKVQPGGRLTYFDGSRRAFYAMNARYEVVDSFRCGNGYTTDNHELQILANGHALLMAYDTQIVDMSQIVLGGRTSARVIGLIIQELDREKNVVFQWRSWDHFQITDVISHDLAAPVVDYVHGNSIDADPDGNLYISSRHMNEVTKISRTTGEILWRLGGRNNQFTFLNDPIQFSHQHDARRLPNGNILLFDNGNFRFPLFSRAVEYAIDEAQRTATLVWQHRLTPDVFGPALGSAQRLPNGNTLIGWGATNPTLTEVAPDGFLVSELTFEPRVATYRAFRFEWPPVKPATVTFFPATLSLDGRGGGVYATVRSEGAFDVAEVDLSTVRLAGVVPADPATARSVDSNGDQVLDLLVRFPRIPLLPLLSLGLNRLEVTGQLATGEIFRGSADLLLVSSTSRTTAQSLRLVSAPGVIPVELETGGGGGVGARTLAVYDIQGRLVRRWQAEPGRSGRVSWDGRAADGRRVGSGVYFLRIEEGERGPALKAVITR